MLSAHFSEAEFLHTGTGLPNEPVQLLRYGLIYTPEAIRQNAVRLAHTLLDPLSEAFAGWGISSWYRSPGVNAAVHGAPNSAHLVGLAADGHPLHGTFEEAIVFLAASKLPFDRVIFEERGAGSRWLHVQAPTEHASPSRVFFHSPAAGGYLLKTGAELARIAAAAVKEPSC